MAKHKWSSFVVKKPNFQYTKMGGSQSSEKSTDIEASGQVNNQFVVRSPVDIQSTEIFIILAILCALRLLEVMYGLYRACKRNIQHRMREAERERVDLILNQARVPRATPTPRPNGSNNV